MYVSSPSITLKYGSWKSFFSADRRSFSSTPGRKKSWYSEASPFSVSTGGNSVLAAGRAAAGAAAAGGTLASGTTGFGAAHRHRLRHALPVLLQPIHEHVGLLRVEVEVITFRLVVEQLQLESRMQPLRAHAVLPQHARPRAELA